MSGMQWQSTEGKQHPLKLKLKIKSKIKLVF